MLERPWQHRHIVDLPILSLDLDVVLRPPHLDEGDLFCHLPTAFLVADVLRVSK
jgi:hypothetical protein